MKKYDVTALGELLIDFTESGHSAQDNSLFEACPGGAPCNVLALLNKLDKKTAFIGKVGNDMFGLLLKNLIEEVGIDTTGLALSDDIRTTLAFVKTYADGDRDFSFYRNPGADMALTEEELPMDVLKNTRIFHFGTLSMTHPGVRQATKTAVKTAKEAGALISFDPNLRPPLWSDLEEAKQQISYGLSVCDIVKIADNEVEFMTGETDFVKAAAILKEQYPQIKILDITAGANGSYCFYKDRYVFVPSYKLGGTIETTGAGDTFCGSVLNYALDHDIDNLTEAQMTEMLSFANAAAYLVTTRKGAIKAMPERADVEAIIQNN